MVPNANNLLKLIGWRVPVGPKPMHSRKLAIAASLLTVAYMALWLAFGGIEPSEIDRWNFVTRAVSGLRAMDGRWAVVAALSSCSAFFVSLRMIASEIPEQPIRVCARFVFALSIPLVAATLALGGWLIVFGGAYLLRAL